MPINGVSSVLPDPDYVRELEAELRNLRSLVNQAISTANYVKGRVNNG